MDSRAQLEQARTEGRAEALDIVAQNLRTQLRAWQREDTFGRSLPAKISAAFLSSERERWAARIEALARQATDEAARLRKTLPVMTPRKGVLAKLLGL